MMKRLLFTFSIIVFTLLQSGAQKPIHQLRKNDSMNRIERAGQTYEKLFQQVQSVSGSDDPELMTILQRFIFGEVFYIGNLNDASREIITITALATNQTLPQLRAHT